MNQDCADDFWTYIIQKLIEYTSGEEEYDLLLSSFNIAISIAINEMNQKGFM